MITDLGKFLRKVRIDNDEILLDMAKKLGVSVSFLSSVETGKKNMPDKWIEAIPTMYKFSKDEVKEFHKAISHSKTSIQFDLSSVSNDRKELVFSLARSIDDFDDDQIESINKILSEVNKNDAI